MAQRESLRFKRIGGLAVRRACYGVARFIMESGAKGCEVIISRHRLHCPGPWPFWHTINRMIAGRVLVTRTTSSVPLPPAVPWAMAFLAHHEVVSLQAGEPP